MRALGMLARDHRPGDFRKRHGTHGILSAVGGIDAKGTLMDESDASTGSGASGGGITRGELLKAAAIFEGVKCCVKNGSR